MNFYKIKAETLIADKLEFKMSQLLNQQYRYYIAKVKIK